MKFRIEVLVENDGSYYYWTITHIRQKVSETTCDWLCECVSNGCLEGLQGRMASGESKRIRVLLELMSRRYWSDWGWEYDSEIEIIRYRTIKRYLPISDKAWCRKNYRAKS